MPSIIFGLGEFSFPSRVGLKNFVDKIFMQIVLFVEFVKTLVLQSTVRILFFSSSQNVGIITKKY